MPEPRIYKFRTLNIHLYKHNAFSKHVYESKYFGKGIEKLCIGTNHVLTNPCIEDKPVRMHLPGCRLRACSYVCYDVYGQNVKHAIYQDKTELSI